MLHNSRRPPAHPLGPVERIIEVPVERINERIVEVDVPVEVEASEGVPRSPQAVSLSAGAKDVIYQNLCLQVQKCAHFMFPTRSC